MPSISETVSVELIVNMQTPLEQALLVRERNGETLVVSIPRMSRRNVDTNIEKFFIEV